MSMFKALGLNNFITGKITKGLVLSQFLSSSLEVSKIINNRESQGRLKGRRDISTKFKDLKLIAGIGIHLVQSSPQTMDSIMIYKYMVYSILHQVKHLA